MTNMQNMVGTLAGNFGYSRSDVVSPDGAVCYLRDVIDTPDHRITDVVNVGTDEGGGINARYERWEDDVRVIEGYAQGISLENLSTFMMGPGVYSAAKVPNMKISPTLSREEIERMGADLWGKILTLSVADWYSDHYSTPNHRDLRKIEDYPDLAALIDGTKVLIVSTEKHMSEGSPVHHVRYGTIQGYEYGLGHGLDQKLEPGYKHGHLTVVDYAIFEIPADLIPIVPENQKSLLDILKGLDSREKAHIVTNLTTLPGPQHWISSLIIPDWEVYIVTPNKVGKS